ncbi:MAG: hypothetical protein IT285_12785 [Bdellovibrionales bacterium]|nr:hypothetical protein [Bdellovibrionales bacterium]
MESKTAPVTIGNALGRLWATFGPVLGLLICLAAGARDLRAGEISGTGRLVDFPNLDIRQVETLLVKNLGNVPADQVRNFVIRDPEAAFELRNLAAIELWSGQVKRAQEIERVTVRIAAP